MGFCTNCGSVVPDASQYCGGCGAKAGQATAPVATTGPSTDVGLRTGAYLIDVIPAVIVSLAVGWIPIVGAIMVGFILLAYWLLRDITGSSLGKLVLGLTVVRKDGSPSGPKDRILRNLSIAIGPALLIIPLAGYAIAPPIAGILVLTEAVLLLSKKERLGDMLAGTTVVKKAAMVNAASA